MTLRCVVGGCLQKDDQVQTCYYNVAGHVSKEHASLDLCWFHQETLASRMISTWNYGWDPIKED